METIMIGVGLAATILLLILAGTACFSVAGDWYRTAMWRFGEGREMRRSVRLGWNVGLPPEGAEILVREHASQYTHALDPTRGWAVMVREGDMCWTHNRGFGMPVKQVTGWLLVSDGPEGAVGPLVDAAPDLLEELEEAAGLLHCGCGHPACRQCVRDKRWQEVIDWASGHQSEKDEQE